jgi:hypothetical protein
MTKRKTTKVIYRCQPGSSTRGGMIDAGPDVIITLKRGTLYLKGPEIDYRVERVAYYTAEEVWV